MLRHEKRGGGKNGNTGRDAYEHKQWRDVFFEVWYVIKRIIKNNIEKKESLFDGCTINMERHNVDLRTTAQRFDITFEIHNSWKKIK